MTIAISSLREKLVQRCRSLTEMNIYFFVFLEMLVTFSKETVEMYIAMMGFQNCFLSESRLLPTDSGTGILLQAPPKIPILPCPGLAGRVGGASGDGVLQGDPPK